LSFSSTVLVLLRDSRAGLLVPGLRERDCGVGEAGFRVFARASSELGGLGKDRDDDLGGEGACGCVVVPVLMLVLVLAPVSTRAAVLGIGSVGRSGSCCCCCCC